MRQDSLYKGLMPALPPTVYSGFQCLQNLRAIIQKDPQGTS